MKGISEYHLKNIEKDFDTILFDEETAKDRIIRNISFYPSLLLHLKEITNKPESAETIISIIEVDNIKEKISSMNSTDVKNLLFLTKDLLYELHES